MNAILSLIFPPLLWGASNLTDTFLAGERNYDRVMLLLFLGSAIGFITTLALVLSGAAPWEMEANEFIRTALSGAFMAGGTFPYYLGLQRSSPIVMVVTMQTIPVFNHGFAALLLGEHLSLLQWVGILCIIISALIAAEVHHAWKKGVAPSGFLYGLLTSILLALPAPLFRSGSVSAVSYLDGICAAQIGVASLTLPLLLFPRMRRVLRESRPLIKTKFAYLVFINEIVAQIANSWVRCASYVFPVSIVGPTTQALQSIYVFLATFLLPLAFPKLRGVFHTETRPGTLGISVALSIVGIILLYS